MILNLYQIDAFSSKVFGGNPAGVCPLEQWLADDLMQKIASENNLSETAFFVRENSRYHIRWFTPAVEVDLCGHATLGSAWVIFNELAYEGDEIILQSRSGELKVRKSGRQLILDFPADSISEYELTEDLKECFNSIPVEVLKGKTDFLFVFDDEDKIRNIKPDLKKIASINCRGIIVTSPGKEVDFVSRFFAPQSGVDEDPVTGSAHTTLTPFWSRKLRKLKLTARQLSARTGDLECELQSDRVEITGYAVKYLEGRIYLPD